METNELIDHISELFIGMYIAGIDPRKTAKLLHRAFGNELALRAAHRSRAMFRQRAESELKNAGVFH
tara:strand:+ start:2192 stop:2392 length:201 start_codon:yes stop_codon:yes gene_type:complete